MLVSDSSSVAQTLQNGAFWAADCLRLIQLSMSAVDVFMLRSSMSFLWLRDRETLFNYIPATLRASLNDASVSHILSIVLRECNDDVLNLSIVSADLIQDDLVRRMRHSVLLIVYTECWWCGGRLPFRWHWLFTCEACGESLHLGCGSLVPPEIVPGTMFMCIRCLSINVRRQLL